MFIQLLLLLLLLMAFSLETFGFSPPYAVIAGIGPAKRRLEIFIALAIMFCVSGMYVVFNLSHAVGNKQRIHCFNLLF